MVESLLHWINNSYARKKIDNSGAALEFEQIDRERKLRACHAFTTSPAVLGEGNCMR
jgi:hypothetical protein